MQSTLNLKNADPHDVFMITPEVALAPRAEPEMEPAPAPQMISPALMATAAPLVDTTFRASAVDPANPLRARGAFGKWAKRAAFVFVVALGSVFAAAAWKEHGDTARDMVAEWLPQFSLTSSSESSPSVNTEIAEPVSAAPAAVQTAATDQAPAQPVAPSVQAAETPAPATAVSADLQPLQTMARDLAAMSQQIAQLRASLDQLKAGQEQIARDLAAKTAEAKPVTAPVVRPKTVAPPPPARPHAAATPPAPRPRVSSYPAYPAYPTQAAAPPPPASSAASAPAYPAASSHPQPPSEPQPVATADDGGPLVRPPMPLR